jgi:hypothetical protein
LPISRVNIHNEGGRVNLLELLVVGAIAHGGYGPVEKKSDAFDTDWKRVAKTTWSRSLNNFTGSATIIVTVKESRLWYTVEEKCPRSRRKRVTVWEAGSAMAIVRTCNETYERTANAPAWEDAAGALPPEAKLLLRPNSRI